MCVPIPRQDQRNAVQRKGTGVLKEKREKSGSFRQKLLKSQCLSVDATPWYFFKDPQETPMCSKVWEAPLWRNALSKTELLHWERMPLVFIYTPTLPHGLIPAPPQWAAGSLRMDDQHLGTKGWLPCLQVGPTLWASSCFKLPYGVSLKLDSNWDNNLALSLLPALTCPSSPCLLRASPSKVTCNLNLCPGSAPGPWLQIPQSSELFAIDTPFGSNDGDCSKMS